MGVQEDWETYIEDLKAELTEQLRDKY